MLLSYLDHISFNDPAVQTCIRILFSVSVLAAVTAYATRRAILSLKHPKHLRRIGITGRSNLDDQFDSKHDESSETRPIRVKALYVHPIKSCAPIEVESARLTKIGLAYDRCFAFATFRDDGGWDFISQRTKPKLALVRQELWLPDDKSDINDQLVKAGGCLVVSFPDPDPPNFTVRVQTVLENGRWGSEPRVTVQVPLLPERMDEYESGLPMRSFKIHSRMARGLNYGSIPEIVAILPKLKRFLNISDKQELMLLRCTDETLTRTTKNLAPLKHIGKPAEIGYMDQQPVHIVSLPSVHAFATLLPPENQPLDARRFRANVYLTGPPAYDEETWKRYRVRPGMNSKNSQKQSPTLSVVCRTSRCTMPNVIPEKGIFEEQNPADGRTKGKAQPSTALIEHRTVEDGNPKALGYMGMHCVPEDASLADATDSEEGVWISVGDEVEVLETGTHLYGSTANDY